MAATRTHSQAIDERNTQTATMSYAMLRAGDAHPLLRGERRRSIAGPGRIGSGNQEGVWRLRLSDGNADRTAICDFLLADGYPDRGVGGSVQSPERPGHGGGHVERDDGAFRDSRELHDAVPDAHRYAIGEAGGSPPSHSLISDYFPRAGAGRHLPSTRWRCRWARRWRGDWWDGAIRIWDGGTRSSRSEFPASSWPSSCSSP